MGKRRTSGQSLATCEPEWRTSLGMSGEPKSVSPTMLVSIDLDGTLIPGASTVQLLAHALGHEAQAEEAEKAYQDGTWDNIRLADELGKYLTGIPLSTIRRVYEQAPRIGGIYETIDALHRKGAHVLLASVTWKFFVEMFAEEYGFDDCCGTPMVINDGVLTGRVVSYFTEFDKAEYFTRTLRTLGLAAARSVAVGDSRSDREVFKAAGVSIAINADRTTRSLADHAIETTDLRDILSLV